MSWRQSESGMDGGLPVWLICSELKQPPLMVAECCPNDVADRMFGADQRPRCEEEETRQATEPWIYLSASKIRILWSQEEVASSAHRQ